MAEYIALKGRGNPVHWLWACIVLPEFRVLDPKAQFKNYVSKIKRCVSASWIDISVLPDERDSYAHVESISDEIVSNVKEVTATYQQALTLHGQGRVAEAIETLSAVSARQDQDWYLFTDAYMDLARWIRDRQFEGVGDDVIRKCERFLQWYWKRLWTGKSRIEIFRQKQGLDQESKNEFDEILTELKEVQQLCNALTQRIPASVDYRKYNELAKLILNAREELVPMRETSSDYQAKQEDSIARIRKLESSSEEVAEVLEFGREVCRRQVDDRFTRGRLDRQSVEMQRQDLYEGVYWEFSEVIVELECFDQFEQKGGNELGALRHYLCSELEKKLKSAGT